MLRAQVKEGTDLGQAAEEFMDRGDLVPDDVIIGMILSCVQEGSCADGFLLDGFPRTREQADALTDALESAGAHAHRRPGDRRPRRGDHQADLRRRVCSKAGHVYHVEFDPPKHEGVCDQDGSKLVQRDDDKPETVQNRLDVFHAQTAEVIPYYEERGLLRRFDGTRSPTEVHDHIRATIATLRLEDQL